MFKDKAKDNNNLISWLWSYITWPYTYFYPKKDNDHDFANPSKRSSGGPHFSDISHGSLAIQAELTRHKKDDDYPANSTKKTSQPENAEFILAPWTTKLTRLVNYTEWAPYKACRRAYAIVAPIIGPEKLKAILLTEFLATLALNLLNLAIATELAKDKGAFDSLLSNTPLKGGMNNEPVHDFVVNMAKGFGVHCAMSSSIFLVNQSAVRVSELIIKFPAIGKLFEKLFKSQDPEQPPLYVSALSTEGANVIIPSVPQSLGVVIRLGNKSFVSAVNAGCNGLFSAAMLYNTTTNYNSIFYSNPLIPKIAFSLITGAVSGGLNYIYTKKRETDAPLVTELKEIESNNYTPTSYFSKAILGGGEFSVYQSRRKMDNIQFGEIDSTALETVAQWWSFLVKNLDKPFNYFLTAMQILRGSSTSLHSTTLMHLENVSAVTNWSSDNSPDISAMSEHLNKIERFNNILDNCSKQRRPFTRTFNGLTQEIIINVCIHKYEPKIAGSIAKYTDSPEKDPEYQLIYAADFKIPLEVQRDNKTEKVRALISAPAGIGKSTLLNALNNISLPGAPVTGTFCFPKGYDEQGKRQNFFMLPQDIVMPLHVSFLELLCYPTPITTSQDTKKPSVLNFKGLGESLGILTPFEPINILSKEREEYILQVAAHVVKALNFSDKFDTFFKHPYARKANWNDKSLSGGEKRVIPLIWAVLKNPKILFMDESDANLDLKRDDGTPGRAVHFQKILHELLPDTSILAISHNDNKESVDVSTHPFYNHVCALEEHNKAKEMIATTPVILRSATPLPVPLKRSSSIIEGLLSRVKQPSEQGLDIGLSLDTAFESCSNSTDQQFLTIGPADVENRFTIKEILRRARGTHDSLSTQHF